MKTEAKCKKCGKPNPHRDWAISGSVDRCLKCVNAVHFAEWGEEEIQNRLILGSVPLRFRTIQPTSLAQERMKIVNQVFQFQKPLILQGRTGSGKTLTLALLARELVKRCNSVMYLDCASMADYLRGNIERTPIVTANCQRVSHLLIDDFGAECDKTGWWAAWLGAVVNTRYAALMPTSMATNRDLEQAESRMLRRFTESSLVFSNMQVDA